MPTHSYTGQLAAPYGVTGWAPGYSFSISFWQDPNTGVCSNLQASGTFTSEAWRWPVDQTNNTLSNFAIKISNNKFGWNQSVASNDQYPFGYYGSSTSPASSISAATKSHSASSYSGWTYTPSNHELTTGGFPIHITMSATSTGQMTSLGANHGYGMKVDLMHTFTPPDSTPPTISGPTYNSSDVTLVGPDIYVKTSSITISYSATDTESGVAGIWIDGVQASSSGSASKTYTVTADFTSSAYARDNASNQSPTVSQLFKFDNIPPTISNFIVNSATTSVSGQDFFVDYPNTTCDFEFTVTDNESGLNSYKATNASGTVTTGSLSGASQTITLSHDLNEANSSEIKYELEVEDKAGNISTQSSPIVIVDDTPPTGTLAIDSSQTTNVVDSITYINTSDVKLSITKSDSESGLF